MWEQTRIACTQISEACLGCRAEEEEEVNHSKYLGSHREEESLDEETRGHQIREAEREILPAAFVHLVFIESVTMVSRDPLDQLRQTKERPYARAN